MYFILLVFLVSYGTYIYILTEKCDLRQSRASQRIKDIVYGRALDCDVFTADSAQRGLVSLERGRRVKKERPIIARLRTTVVYLVDVLPRTFRLAIRFYCRSLQLLLLFNLSPGSSRLLAFRR